MTSTQPETPQPANSAPDDIVAAVLGNWGRWQRRSVFLIYLCKIPSAWFMACIIFTAPMPRAGEFICRSHLNASEPMGLDVAIALANETSTMLAAARSDHFDQELNVDACVHHVQTDGELQRQHCTDFEHLSDFVSLVTQFDLVCSKTILIAVTQFFHLFGVLTGGILATKLLEIQSPRSLMLFGMLTQIFCGCITGLTGQFEVHVFFRCLSAVCCAQMYTAGQMIFSDITGGAQRSTSVCLFETFWSLGVMLLPLLALAQPDWYSLYLMISLPTCLYTLLWPLIPDSPRWLIRHGRLNEARLQLLAGHTYNKGSAAPLPVDFEERLLAAGDSAVKPVEGGSWWTLWRGETVVAVMAAHVAWAVYVTNYNGMLLNVKAYGRDFLSLNTVVFGLCEIVGVLVGLALILRVRRKWLWAGLANIIAGLGTVTGFFLPSTLSAHESTAILMATAGLAKVAVSIAQSMLFTSTGELVAPEQRPAMLLSCVIFARFWLLTAPFIGALAGFHQSLGLAAFGTLSICGGMALLVLPKRAKN